MSNIKGSKLFREAIRILDRKINALEAAEFAGRGITHSQCRALDELGRAGSISLGELAGILGLDSSTMSRTVNNLVAQGLASREADLEDRRYISIALTEQGQNIYDEIEVSMDAHFDDIFVQIPEEKRRGVLEDLILIIEALDKSGSV